MKEIMNLFWKQNLVGVVYKGNWAIENDRNEHATFLAVWRHVGDEISMEYFFRDRIPDSAIKAWKDSGLRVAPLGSTNKGVDGIAK
jgi:hemolysin-activating ACP:hemolysin acyltransferase